MLARVSSGSGGIAEYLTTGRKKGREFDRDLIDERITLEGDLVIADCVIEGIETAQDGDSKYLHISLGFSEDFTAADDTQPGQINIDVIKRVTAAYREALMAAFDPSEYTFYAEAHIPKVTHEINASNGEYEKRLPHVHIVIPMRNLDTDQYLNPFGFGKTTLMYAEAIQEKINADFGLRSPKDSTRAQPRADHPLAKHNPNFEELSPKQVKASINALIATGDIRSFDALAKAAEQFGVVRVRSGKEGDYLNVKPAWADKGINLKEVTREGFEVVAQALRKGAAPSTDYPALVTQWVTQTAFEARYVTSGNRKIYQELNPQEKSALLQRKQQETRARLTPPPEEINERPDYDAIDPTQHGRASRAAALLQSSYTKARQSRPPESLAGLRNLSSLPLVQEWRHSAMLLQSHAPDRMGPAGNARPKMRWTRVSDSRIDGTRLGAIRARSISVVDSLKQKNGPDEISADKIKRDTSPSIVLADAVKRYGIKLEDYAITTAKDGMPRIRHAGKHYNLGDFYTKHLGVSWEEARPILTSHYHMTLSNGLPPPDKSLWKSFSTFRTKDLAEEKAEIAAIRANARQQIVEARNVYKALKLSSRGLRKLRQAMLAKGRAEQLVKVAAIKQEEEAALQKAKRPSRNAQYRLFLNNLASQGDLQALGELRRMAPPDTQSGDTISGAKSADVLPLPSYKIDHNGQVTYFKEETAVVTDSVKGVSVIDTQPNAYDIALKVAVARYGKDLTFNGDKLFMKNMTEAARKSGMDLIIRNGEKPREAPVIISRPPPRAPYKAGPKMQ